MSELSKIDDNIMRNVELGMQQPPPGMQQQHHGLYVEFYMHPVEDKEQSAKEGRPIFKEVPYVMIMVPGDKDNVQRRPVRLGQLPNHDNNRFHNEYIHFVQNKEAPLEGTPLSEWPQITRSQVMELNHFNIRTVEDLANVADVTAQKYMGLNMLKAKAKQWLELTAADAPFTKMQAELEERDERLAAQDAAIAEMQAELAELKKPKRGSKKDD